MKTTIGEIAEIQIGYQAKGRIVSEPTSRFRILQLKDFEGGRLATDLGQLTPMTPERSPDSYRVGEGDVLFACRGPHNFTFHITMPLEWVLATNAFYILRPNRDIILPEYLTWWLNLGTTQDTLTSLRSISTMPLVPKSALAELEIQLPSMDVQAKILGIWDTAAREYKLTLAMAEKRLKLARQCCLLASTGQLKARPRHFDTVGVTPPLLYDYVLEGLSVENISNEGSEYSFNLRGIPTTITVRLYRREARGPVWFEQSHWIKTPEQIGPYRTSRPFNDDEASALRQAVTGLTQFYDMAVKAGHEPSKAWLVENKNFNSEDRS